MKNKIINAIFYIITGALLIVGPHTLFKVCDTTEKIMKCWWSTRAEIAIGGLIVFSGIIILFLKNKGVLHTINLNNIASGIAAILIPSVLIGGCGKETMPCRSLTFPAIYIIGAAVILFSIVNLIYSKKSAGK